MMTASHFLECYAAAQQFSGREKFVEGSDLSCIPTPWFFPLLTLCLVPSAGDVERARALKEEGNELVKKGNHKKALEKYSESLSFSNLESATYSNRYLGHSCWSGAFQTLQVVFRSALRLA